MRYGRAPVTGALALLALSGLAVDAAACGVLLVVSAASAQVKPAPRGAFVGYKSPASGMHFTEGIPIRVLADAIDPGGWQGKTRKMEAEETRFYVDGKLVATVPPLPTGYNYFETILTGLKVGPRVLTLESTNFGGGVATSDPVTITIDPPARRAKTLTLAQDLVLDGATDLDWTDTVVDGKGFKVRSAPGWKGSVVIRGSFVTGLGAWTTPGIDVKTSGGSVTIERSVFEGTGAVFVGVDGTGGMTIRSNEFRSSNLIKFVSSNPSRSPVFRATGNASGTKVFQSNRVGAGILEFEGMSGWLIGGDTDAESNIFIGPRCVLNLLRCRSVRVIGNYMHHDYRGGWSQGFNLYCEGSRDILAEHNVIRDSSWLVQSFPGEFRYNLVVDSGHNWVRSLDTGTTLHHNVFIHRSHGGGVNSGIWTYKGEQDVGAWNNTFDCGSPVFRGFTAPIIEVSKGCRWTSIRNNAFLNVRAPENVPPRPIVDRGRNEKDTDPRIAYADYNCFHNPQVSKAAHYAPGIVEGKPGAHDVNAEAKLTLGTIAPYAVDEEAVWVGKLKVSAVLAEYRGQYTPAAGSPLIGAGDPADGKDAFIGAVGPAGCTRADDRFGKFSVKQP